VHEPLLQAFTFPSTLGELTLHLLSQACMFIYSSHGKWVFPCSPVEFPSQHRFYKLSCSSLLGVCCCSCQPACLFIAHIVSGSSPLSCVVFLPLPLLQAFPLLVAGRAPPLPPSVARSGLFIYSSRKDSPPSLFGAQSTPPSLLGVFIVLISYYSVSHFSPRWRSVCPGGCADLAQDCLWKYHVLLSSPFPHLPKPSGCGRLAAQGPSWFLSIFF
jgi:hypothetical protein